MFPKIYHWSHSDSFDQHCDNRFLYSPFRVKLINEESSCQRKSWIQFVACARSSKWYFYIRFTAIIWFKPEDANDTFLTSNCQIYLDERFKWFTCLKQHLNYNIFSTICWPLKWIWCHMMIVVMINIFLVLKWWHKSFFFENDGYKHLRVQLLKIIVNLIFRQINNYHAATDKLLRTSRLERATKVWEKQQIRCQSDPAEKKSLLNVYEID